MKYYTMISKKSIKYLLAFILVYCLTCINNNKLYSQISVLKKGTDNPTLLYKSKPMFKFGPLPETGVFATKWGTSTFRHKEWLDWMEENRLGYGRVYPESGITIGGETDTEVSPGDESRLFPFKIAHWKEGRPIFDITQFNPEYWSNFARVIAECANRGIILQMQIYQRVYFSGSGSWHSNYYNPDNNINKFPFPERKGGYGLFTAMMEDPLWRNLHKQWVQHILAGIGNNGNVIIDLMNEGSFQDAGLTKDWVEYTLDIIEKWEKDNGLDIMTGFDFDHIYKKKDPFLEYILSHPGMEIIISEGSEGHVVPELVAGDRPIQSVCLAGEYRKKYHKPVISTNSPSYSVSEDLWKVHLYQWYSLMIKVQGAGVYAKIFPIDFTNPVVKKYANCSKIISEFFDKINDYGELDIASGIIMKGPGKYRMALASTKEIVVYLHSGEQSEQFRAGEKLILKDIPFSNDGNLKIYLLYPSTGESVRIEGKINNKQLAIKLPEFNNDIAIHFTNY